MDLMASAKSILGTVAPTIASAFLGPFGGMATQAVISALGLAPETTKEAALTAVANATPEQLLKLKQVDAQLAVDLKKLDIDTLKINAEDTKDARSREIQTHDWTPRVLAGLIVSLYIGVQIAVFTLVIDPSMRDLVMRSMGTLDAALGLVLGYYYGSSSGSAAKTKQLSEVINIQK